MYKFRLLASIFLLLATLLVRCAFAQSNLTQIRDTIYNADGTLFNGTVVITFTGTPSTTSGSVSPLSTSARIYNGALSVLLVPTTTAGANSYYQVVYTSSDGTTQWTETWSVPPSTNPLSVAGVRTSSTGGGGTTSTSSTGSTGSSGSSGTTTSGSTQYATLPIAMSQVTGLSSSLSTLTNSVATNTSAVTGLQSTVSGLQSSVSTLQSSSTSANNAVSGLQTTVGSLNTNVTGLQSTVSGLSSTVSGLQSSYTTLNNTIGGLESSNTSLSNSVIGIQSAYTTLGNTVSGLQSSITSLNSNVTGLQTSYGTLNSTVSGLQTSLSTTNTSLSNLQTSENGLSNIVGGINSTVTGLQSSVSSLTTTVNGLSSGSSVSFAFVDADPVSGTINGTNTSFTLTGTPSPAASLALYKNGLLLKAGTDYTLSASAVTFSSASIPKTGDKLEAFYRVAGTSTTPNFSDSETPGGSINGANATFTLAYSPNPARSLELFKNGVLLMQGSDYTLAASTITFSTSVIPQSGDVLSASYRH